MDGLAQVARQGTSAISANVVEQMRVDRDLAESEAERGEDE
jgi:hypothetical protein